MFIHNEDLTVLFTNVKFSQLQLKQQTYPTHLFCFGLEETFNPFAFEKDPKFFLFFACITLLIIDDHWIFFFWFVDYCTHFEPSQSIGGAKMGDPREKTPYHPQAELGLSHMWPKQGSNLQRWDVKWFRVLKSSVLNHSTMGAAYWRNEICILLRLDIVIDVNVNTKTVLKSFISSFLTWLKWFNTVLTFLY